MLQLKYMLKCLWWCMHHPFASELERDVMCQRLVDEWESELND